MEQLQRQEQSNCDISKIPIKPKSYEYPLLNDIIKCVPKPNNNNNNKKNIGQTYLTLGDFQYFHYGCDGYQDHGWGCAYRSLQSMCSWILNKKGQSENVPSIEEIQKTLVMLGDKNQKFIDSRDWIGALEVCYVIDALYNVPSKIIHVTKLEKLENHIESLAKYFQDIGGFVMMGGDMDASSKGIAGMHRDRENTYLLIVDPHFSGVPTSVQELIDKGYIRWRNINEFIDNSFYNLCLPILR
ncbi:probable Ufm1-specific protease 1 [Glossina fuscipes]|uniref:Probable Ufm1-specific protease 1 n=1 Tax=Glossina fuscipes TaxID=7396 RepID=A0A9C5ZBN6_9MUSC|nr:probable Ufm1-specific protease 1 [Glossina fuscipes]